MEKPSIKQFLSNHPLWKDISSSSSPKCGLYFSNFMISPSNKHRFADRIEFWKTTLKDVCKGGYFGDSQLSFDSDNIERHFQVGSLRPLGMQSILSELQSDGTLVLLDDYESKFTLLGTVSFAIQWGYKYLFTESSNSSTVCFKLHLEIKKIKKLEFAPKEASKELMDKIKQTIIHKYDNIKTLFQVQSLLPRMNSFDLNLILTHLVKNNSIVMTSNDQGEKIIKFKTSKDENDLISEHEKGIGSIKLAIHKLETLVSASQVKIQELLDKAKEYLTLNRKESAKYCLRSKKLCLEKMENHLKNLENLYSILFKIENSKTDAEILETFKIGTSTLKTVLEINQLNTDAIHDIMDDLSDALQDQQELENVLKDRNEELNLTINDDQLEKELDTLIAQELEIKMANLTTINTLPTLSDVQVTTNAKTEASVKTKKAELRESLQI